MVSFKAFFGFIIQMGAFCELGLSLHSSAQASPYFFGQHIWVVSMR